jgi:hypothetical protein
VEEEHEEEDEVQENYKTEVIETHLIEENPLIDALVVNVQLVYSTFFWLTIKN